MKRREVVNGAGSHDGPDAFTPAIAGFTAGSLCDKSVDDNEANGLFGNIVGRIDAGSGDKSEIRVAVLNEAIGHVAGGFVFWHISGGGGDDRISLSFESLLEGVGSHF